MTLHGILSCAPAVRWSRLFGQIFRGSFRPRPCIGGCSDGHCDRGTTRRPVPSTWIVLDVSAVRREIFYDPRGSPWAAIQASAASLAANGKRSCARPVCFPQTGLDRNRSAGFRLPRVCASATVTPWHFPCPPTSRWRTRLPSLPRAGSQLAQLAHPQYGARHRRADEPVASAQAGGGERLLQDWERRERLRAGAATTPRRPIARDC